MHRGDCSIASLISSSDLARPVSTYLRYFFGQSLVRPCIRAGSRVGGIVLDPFIGSGTTASVAIEEGRNYIGIDVNPDYVALANKRIETAASAAAQKGVMK